MCSLSPEFLDKFQLRLHEFDLRSIVIHKYINSYGHLQLLQVPLCLDSGSVEILVYFLKMWCQLLMASQNFRRSSFDRWVYIVFGRCPQMRHLDKSFWVVPWKTNNENSVCVTYTVHECDHWWKFQKTYNKSYLWQIIYLICLFSKGFLKLMNLLRILIHLNIKTFLFVNNLNMQEYAIYALCHYIATYMYSTRVLLSKLMLCIVCMYDLESLFEDSPLISKEYTVKMRKALCVTTVHVSQN